ncbi:MAG TPA: hypothetical protein PKC43_07015 [Phycisphaerales bacterium]|nr:hypothetical protein [Phycisphaerales bacterium]HMP37184.1 hypothetical protein [Phycisphaerales bacterium]
MPSIAPIALTLGVVAAGLGVAGYFGVLPGGCGLCCEAPSALSVDLGAVGDGCCERHKSECADKALHCDHAVAASVTQEGMCSLSAAKTCEHAAEPKTDACAEHPHEESDAETPGEAVASR